MSDTAAVFDALWADCTAKNRVVPMPLQRSQLYGTPKDTRQKVSGGWEPPLPLILAAWHHTTPVEKQLRFKKHLERTRQHDQLEQICAFLRALPEAQCCRVGEA